jgi:hypothetical protein
MEESPHLMGKRIPNTIQQFIGIYKPITSEESPHLMGYEELSA